MTEQIMSQEQWDSNERLQSIYIRKGECKKEKGKCHPMLICRKCPFHVGKDEQTQITA